MKQLQIVGPNQPEWQDVDMPQAGAGEVLLKVDAVTTCPHWDLHMMSGEPMFPGARVDYPLTPGQPGHEIVGNVVEVGPGVTDLPVGARVAAWRDRGANVRLGGYAQYVPFAADSLLEVSDFLSLNCPLTPQTTGFLNVERIAKLLDRAVVVNTARGGVVEDTALIAALRSGKLAAAGLDVFTGEPKIDPAYRALDNVFVMPHLGSATREARDAMGFKCAENLLAFFEGREPPDRVA